MKAVTRGEIKRNYRQFFRNPMKMGSHVIWIGIDPNLLLQGIDPARFFGDKSFLKFNLQPPPADEKSGKGVTEEKAGVLYQDQIEPQREEKAKDAEIATQNIQKKTNVKDLDKDPGYREMELCSQNESKDPGKTSDKEQMNKDPDVTSDKEQMNHCSQMAELENNLCTKCGKMFPGELKLREHIETFHKAKISFICQYCDKQYAWEKDLKQHTRFKHIGDLRFGCEHCGKIFKSKYDLDRHVDAIHDTTIHKCGDCSEEFKSKEYLRSHEIQNHSENAKQCPKCSKRFVEERHYDHHVEQDNCSKKTSSELLL